MENGQKTLKNLFDGKKIFKIPEYQRSYAWEIKQLEDFFDDFKNQNLEKEYFLGTILFQKVGKENGFDVIEVVDGQQRITTLIIFINTLIKEYRKLSEKSNMKDNMLKMVKSFEELYIKLFDVYKLYISEDNDFFETYILKDRAMSLNELKKPAHEKLYFAKKFFEQKINNNFSDEMVRNMFKKIDKTRVLTYSVQDKAEATLIFETTNDRGKPLSDLEKIKGFLMYKIYNMFEYPELTLDKIQSRFSIMYRFYSEVKDMPTENEMLRYNFIAYEDLNDVPYMDFIKKKINNLIDMNKGEAHDYIDDFSITLKETYTNVKSILTGKYEEFENLKILGNLETFWPLLIKTYKYDETPNKLNFRKICNFCEIFNFRVYCVLEKGAYTRQSRIYSYARNFDGTSPKGTFEYLEERFKEEEIGYWGFEEEFLNRLTNVNFFNNYSHTIKNYFFWKYENYLRKNEQPISPDVTYDAILNKEDTDDMQKEVQLINANLSNKKLENSIGNLVLDPTVTNATKETKVKIDEYFIRALFKSQNELKSFLDGGQWTEKSIEKRQEKLIKFAKNQWCNLK